LKAETQQRGAAGIPLRFSGFLPLAALISVAIAGTSAVSPLDAETEAELRSLFPEAASFAVKAGQLPHFRVYQGEEPALVGFAYYTTDIEKLERGYKAPINFLVGMTVAGEIIGVRLIEHDEPYGYFSIETDEFSAQFKGKSILDRFRVGRDIDAISSATITIASAARGIRNSGRRIARQFLAEGGS